MSPQAILALQRSVGNTAVSRMIEESRHQHGAGCGHQQNDTAPVQRSAVHDVLRSGGQPLDTATRTDMEARLGADFSDVRLHTGTVAQRSATEVGARAYTSGNHVVIGDGGADRHTLAHELTHVIQQRSGPVAGTDHGNGLAVSDPADRFERAAEANAARVMAAPVQTDAAESTDAHAEGHGHAPAAPVQRAPGDRLALQPDPQTLSTEDHIASLPEDSEQVVSLKRGVTPTQKMGLVKQIIRGSFVSFAKMTQEPDEHATRPDREHAEGYVNQRRDEHTSKLIEFTSDDRLAAIFAAEARFSYVFTVQIKRKYLTKGSHGEKGWMAKQSAPFKISRVERKDSTKEGGAVPLSDAEFHDAVEKERIAELLHSIRETDGLVAYMKQFTSQADKVAAAKRINDYWKQLSGE